jgi:hypothetical protein
MEIEAEMENKGNLLSKRLENTWGPDATLNLESHGKYDNTWDSMKWEDAGEASLDVSYTVAVPTTYIPLASCLAFVYLTYEHKNWDYKGTIDSLQSIFY